MLLSRTKTQPVHYMLEIEGFSILSEDPTIIIESDEFEASGYTWRLELHPNRHYEENRANHISLYLILCDKESWGSHKFHFDVKFFLYDHIGRNYVTFQDVEGKRTSFSEKHTKWGFDKLISLENFRESNKGYLLNDTCVFGVEVIAVPKNTVKDRCFSVIKPPANMNTFSWTVDNFSSVTQRCLVSEVFKVGKVKWTLRLHPKGLGCGFGDFSIFLQLHKPELLPDCWKVYAKFELRVKNQSGYDDRIKETKQYWFSRASSCSEYSEFMNLSEVTDPTKGFLLNDSLTIEAKISVIGMLKNNF